MVFMPTCTAEINEGLWHDDRLQENQMMPVLRNDYFHGIYIQLKPSHKQNTTWSLDKWFRNQSFYHSRNFTEIFKNYTVISTDLRGGRDFRLFVQPVPFDKGKNGVKGQIISPVSQFQIQWPPNRQRLPWTLKRLLNWKRENSLFNL